MCPFKKKCIWKLSCIGFISPFYPRYFPSVYPIFLVYMYNWPLDWKKRTSIQYKFVDIRFQLVFLTRTYLFDDMHDKCNTYTYCEPVFFILFYCIYCPILQNISLAYTQYIFINCYNIIKSTNGDLPYHWWRI